MAVVENSKNSKDGEVYDQAIKNYNSIARRRESRFMQLGTLPGLLCLSSLQELSGPVHRQEGSGGPHQSAHLRLRQAPLGDQAGTLRGRLLPGLCRGRDPQAATSWRPTRWCRRGRGLVMAIPDEYRGDLRERPPRRAPRRGRRGDAWPCTRSSCKTEAVVRAVRQGAINCVPRRLRLQGDARSRSTRSGSS